MLLDTALLDLDHALTILEMRAFFKKNDWSAAKISEPESRASEDHETSISGKTPVKNITETLRMSGIGIIYVLHCRFMMKAGKWNGIMCSMLLY